MNRALIAMICFITALPAPADPPFQARTFGPGPWMLALYEGAQLDVDVSGDPAATSTTLQRELAIGAAWNGCDLLLGAMWMDGSLTGLQTPNGMRAKFSTDGLDWWYPPTPSSTCEAQTPSPNLDGFWVPLFTRYYCTTQPASGQCRPTCTETEPCPGPVDCAGNCFPCNWSLT